MVVNKKRFAVIINIDRSGSMAGSRWNNATDSAIKYIRSLTNEDLVCGIAFNN